MIELDAHEQSIQQLIFSSTRIHLHIILIKIYRQTQEKIGNVIKKDLHKFITFSMVHKIYWIKDTIRRNENKHCMINKLGSHINQSIWNMLKTKS